MFLFTIWIGILSNFSDYVAIGNGSIRIMDSTTGPFAAPA
jgi:hypothetical protein